MKTQRLGKRLFIASLVMIICGYLFAGTAQALTLSSTVLEDNGATVSVGHEPNQALYTGGTAGMGVGVITTAGGYNFTQTTYLTLANITSISVTLTIQDGNSGNIVGSSPPTPDFDYGHLHFALDGTDTGLILNGFRGDGLQDTFTFTGGAFECGDNSGFAPSGRDARRHRIHGQSQ